MKKKMMAFVLAVAMSVALLAGCGSKGGSSSSDNKDGSSSGKTIEIGFCVGNFETPMQITIMDEFQKAMEGYDGNYKIDCQDGKDDPVTQTTIIENFITQQKDLIVLVPCQTDSLVPAVLECNNAGIPVVTINRSLGDGAEVLTEVNMDCYAAGQMEAQLAVELTGGKGNIAYLVGNLGSGPQVQESEGFYDYLKDYPDIKVVFEQTTKWDKATAIQVVQNMLQKYGAGEIDAIITQGPDDAVGAAEACKSEGRTELLNKITAFDYPSYVKEAIEAGEVYATVNQSPKLQGQLAAEVVNTYFTDKDAKFEDLTAIDLNFVYADDVDDYEVAW